MGAFPWMIQDPLQVAVITPNSHILTPTKTPFMCLRTCMKPDTCSYWEFMKKKRFQKSSQVSSA